MVAAALLLPTSSPAQEGFPPPPLRADTGPGLWAGVHVGAVSAQTAVSWVTFGRVLDARLNDAAYAFEPGGDADRRFQRALVLAAVAAGVQTGRLGLALVNTPAMLPPVGLPIDRPRFLVSGLLSGLMNVGFALLELGVLGALQAVAVMPELGGPPSESHGRAEVEAVVNGSLGFVYGGTQIFASILGLQTVAARSRRAGVHPFVAPGSVGVFGVF